MTEQPDIVERLRAACTPSGAQITWPHRLLHDAADEIARLRGIISDADMDGCCCKFEEDGETHTKMCAVHSALKKRAEAAERLINILRKGPIFIAGEEALAAYDKAMK